MPATHQRLYGLDWPVDMHPLFVELVLAKHWREEPYRFGKLRDPGEHLLVAATGLFDPADFAISKWTEEHAHDYTTSDFCITWGCAASGKSNDYGCFTVLDWITDPTLTISILASTTADMLQLRSFESVLRYYRTLKRHPKFLIPGKESKTRLAIINVDDEDGGGPVTTVKASIKGVAVQQGTVEEARSNLQGAHLPYVRLILDELSAMREAAMKARINLSVGALNFKVHGLCNPDNPFDLACRYSEPIGGWGTVDRETSTEWVTKYGKVRRHDGFKSPALKEPKRFPFLIQQSDIDRIAQETGGNTDSADMWTMVRGWYPPQGKDQTVLTEAMLTEFRMRDPVSWSQAGEAPILIAGLDPAFTSGGDSAVLQPARVGHEASTGLLVIAFEPEIVIPIRATASRPDVYQVVDYVLQWAEDNDLDLQYLGVDESGTQRVGDMIEVEAARSGLWKGAGSLCRVSFGSRASEFPVSIRNANPAHKAYGNQVTELWYAVQEFGSHYQIRGLPMAAAEQFCRRQVFPKRPRALEIKADMKKRIKRSPDQADAVACAMAVVRWVLQVVPGATIMKPGGGATAAIPGGLTPEMLRSLDIDREESTYQNSPI